ncbi:MAG: hypothetical protein COB59_10955 [Rhodospirillaceae bacterium]|nr:MAG: hypothetical protein COB59_10955 [Rhodospirillaceae bacterium]
MSEIMHQQRLLLEWLVMAGNIAVSDTDNGSLLYKTQVECEKAGWIKLTQFGSGFFMAAITNLGKQAIRNRRLGRLDNAGPDRRRAMTT